jgi:hypothetical protein
MMVVVIRNCRKESTGGKPGRLVDLAKAAEDNARNSNGNIIEGTIAIGCRTTFIIDLRLSERYAAAELMA